MRIASNTSILSLVISRSLSQSPYLSPALSPLHKNLFISKSKFQYFSSNLLSTSSKRLNLKVDHSVFKAFSRTAVSINAEYPDQPTDYSATSLRDASVTSFYYNAFVSCHNPNAGDSWGANSGGAVYFNSNTNPINFTHCSFTDCYSAKYVGVLYLYASKITVLYNCFNGSKATKSGSVSYIRPTDPLTMKGNSIINSQASNAITQMIRFDVSKLTSISDTNTSSCTCAGQSSGMEIYNCIAEHLQFTYNTFYGNSGKSTLTIVKNSGDVIDSCNFQENTKATTGIVFFLADQSTQSLVLKNCYFTSSSYLLFNSNMGSLVNESTSNTYVSDHEVSSFCFYAFTWTPPVTVMETPMNTAEETVSMTPMNTAVETVFETPMLTAAETVFETPYTTVAITPYETPFSTASDTPLMTESSTPFNTQYETVFATAAETPVETVSSTQHETAAETPYETVSSTQHETVFETPYVTAFETASETPYVTAFSTAFETPYITQFSTAFETPYETVFSTAFETAVETVSSTQHETAFETPYNTAFSTAFETPYETVFSTAFETAVETVATTPSSTASQVVPVTPTEQPATPTEKPSTTSETTNSSNNGAQSGTRTSKKSSNLIYIIIGSVVGFIVILAIIIAAIILSKKKGDDETKSSEYSSKIEETVISSITPSNNTNTSFVTYVVDHSDSSDPFTITNDIADPEEDIEFNWGTNEVSL